MSILGTRVLRREDPAFLTVGGTYVADVRDSILDGALSVTYVRSVMAHALIGAIDCRAALAAPGVVGVFTAADLDAPAPAHSDLVAGLFPDGLARPLLAVDRVRFVGELVAIVVTEHPEQGADAADLVVVDYVPLPVVVDPVAAMAEDAPRVHPDHGSNVCFDIASMGVPTDFRDDFFAGCEVTVSERFVNQRVAACPLEVRSAAAGYADDGRLTMWVSSQTAQLVRNELVKTLGLEEGSVRVIAGPDVGGGFGPEDRRVPGGVVGGVVRGTSEATDAVDRDPHGEHDCDGPWTRSGAAGHDRRDFGWHGDPLPHGGRPRLRRVSDAGRVLAVSHPHDGDGLLRHRQPRDESGVGAHQQDADGRLPRRWPPGGSRGD